MTFDAVVVFGLVFWLFLKSGSSYCVDYHAMSLAILALLARLAFTCSAATIEMHQIIKARKYDPNDLFLQEEQSAVVEFDGWRW